MSAATAGMQDVAQQHSLEVAKGERFEFGKNWSQFLRVLNEDRILKAEESLKEMLEVDSLEGKSFLDIGSGSGLFSLAAKRLGASVHSFDFDSSSYACTKELKRRFFEDDESWTVEQGSALDREYVESLGKYDFVYSWGVLHHTGEMWEAIENASIPVKDDGTFFIAIYNDTGSQVERWKWIKKTYCKLPGPLKSPFAVLVTLPEEGKRLVRAVVKLRPSEFFRFWHTYTTSRGMNRWFDIIDWVGGYPYEVATPDEIFDFGKAKGYRLTKLKVGGVGLGCNEFVFVKERRGGE
ncbi:MAG: 2-polyprenyl-3-methyl-5-hydroxy-6-metoxy-1,4-benzoquinol methylase [Myxococcota bacterium]|jgi:2-polyprenyl-3-methyl-5-hydroxy-6-metoxy-1,4-benzoquinol methylase